VRLRLKHDKMLYTVSADALQGCRLMLDTSAHEGVERGRAAVQGGHGSPQRWADGDGGGSGLGREPAKDACVAGSLRARGEWRGWATGIVCVGYQKVNVAQRHTAALGGIDPNGKCRVARRTEASLSGTG
jgi:hypothetical protein